VVELDGLEVAIDDVLYMPSLEAPPDRPHPFVYFITIRNRSVEPVTIRARKWVVREEGGDTIVVEGTGVVGQEPHLLPGQDFSYNSYHVVNTTSHAEGAFFGDTAAGKRVFARIPVFSMTVPQWA
jgi:ApaG protein